MAPGLAGSKVSASGVRREEGWGVARGKQLESRRATGTEAALTLAQPSVPLCSTFQGHLD